ncbi:hypothetical protein NC653_038390 [Populus alba x Populus x berolinensis]|nr:hypothetical protein NC653_038390 [Populus alba x Populus x berolinensis]
MLNRNPITILKSYPQLDLIELRIYELVTRLGNCFSGTKNEHCQLHHPARTKTGERVGRTGEGRKKTILEERLMRPAFNSTAPAVHAGSYQDRNSPIPYLFSGLGLMFGLVAVALMILACSYRKSSPNSATDPEVQASANQVQMKAEMEPKIVVIMAGDDSPTYLANPVSCNCQSDEQV